MVFTIHNIHKNRQKLTKAVTIHSTGINPVLSDNGYEPLGSSSGNDLWKIPEDHHTLSRIGYDIFHMHVIPNNILWGQFA